MLFDVRNAAGNWPWCFITSRLTACVAGLWRHPDKSGAVLRSVLRFIAQCHAKGIIYRDVKPDNFLFLTPEEKSPIRATDFGLSIRCSFSLSIFSGI